MCGMERLDFAITASIARVRAYARDKGMTKTQLAALSGLHLNTILKLDDPDWRPELKTVRKLESVVPANYKEAA